MDLYKDDVKEAPPQQTSVETESIQKLLDYTEPEQNPWRADYLQSLAECYNFVELKQWAGDDVQGLAQYDVPTLAVDRVNRGLDTIRGISDNTGIKKKVQKRELGDERVASILDAVGDYVAYQGNFEEAQEKSRDDMLIVGMGLRKLGFDPEASGGEGELWVEAVNVEDVGWSRCKSKTLRDSNWLWHLQMMDWEDAVSINPEKAPQLKSLKAKLESEWEKKKKSNVKGALATKDYKNPVGVEKSYQYPDQVYIYEFWSKRRIPVTKVGTITQLAQPDGQGGFVQVPVPQVRLEALDYQPQEGEQVLAKTVIDEWWQYIVASGRNKRQGILLKVEKSKYPFHPFIGTCAEVKKSGQPFGYVERVIPHQKRINIAWAQKVAYNNKSIKSPLVLRDVKNVDKAIQQSKFGAILNLTGNERVESVNIQPQVNLQAIEEGNMARMDMDFAAAATESPLRGIEESGASGIKLSLQQNAAITPLNKWVKSEKESEREFWRKALYIIIAEFKPERMARIVGEQKFMELVIGPKDPMTGQPLQPPLQLPLQPSVAHYDVMIQDEALSDFNKQQSFNAAMALHQGGVLLKDETLIKSAPIKDVDEFLSSNLQARQDVIRQQQQIIQMLEDKLNMAMKAIPKEKKNGQAANAVQGRNQPQAGQRSMLGGMMGMQT